MRITHSAVDLAGRKAVVETLEDITEHKQTEKLAAALSRSATVSVYIVQGGRSRYINPEFQKQTDYIEEELLGANSLSLVLPEDREMVRENEQEGKASVWGYTSPRCWSMPTAGVSGSRAGSHTQRVPGAAKAAPSTSPCHSQNRIIIRTCCLPALFHIGVGRLARRRGKRETRRGSIF